MPSLTIDGGGFNQNCVEHEVSKLDTLAGVAIKYGVEVADIKRVNGLATDLQMFALKTLQIPLPGRHPPSPSFSGASSAAADGEKSTEKRSPPSSLKPFQPTRAKPSSGKLSPSMGSLQNDYGLMSQNKRASVEGMEMAVYKKAGSGYGFNRPEKLSKEENGNGNGSSSYSETKGEGLALRAKSATRKSLDLGPGWLNSTHMADGLSPVRKSSSLSSLQDREQNCSSSIFSNSRWSLKPDLQALCSASVVIPLFDGLPKPLSGRWNKAALD